MQTTNSDSTNKRYSPNELNDEDDALTLEMLEIIRQKRAEQAQAEEEKRLRLKKTS